MNRRTKIVATIGPASEDEATLRAMIRAGMDVARLGLAHNTIDEGLERFHRIRKVSEEEGRRVGILVDLPGPKVRAGNFGETGVKVTSGSSIELRVGEAGSSADVIEVDYEFLMRDIQVGDRVTIGDGGAVLEVTDKKADKMLANVVSGSTLRGRPGVHIPSDRLQIPTPTPGDFVALDAFVEAGIDMVAVSFVRSAHDMRRVGTEPHPRGPLLVAKIETRAAVDNLPGIIEASGAVMVARGDLGNECSLEDLPHLQKDIIRQCIAGGRPVITATQMLESMVTSLAPTRAEASDVANAVFDGSSAVMLSGETAVGSDPTNVVRTMSRIARRADEEMDYPAWARRLTEMRMTDRSESTSVTDAMTMAAWRATQELGIQNVLCISGSGFTVRSMARFRPEANLLGFSLNEATVQQLTLSWGTTPMLMGKGGTNEEMVAEAMRLAKSAGHIRPGELVGVLAGSDSRAQATNVLRVERVP
ncbi:MAG TPA: pyruvate kinase [Acidimicrobiaceae bacterium]|nr:pyruvate kinase [Acidimicrobiaceae bacterium]